MAELSPQKAYNILVDYCDKIARSKYILSTTAIKNMLRFIANTPCLYNYVAKCNQSIKFKDEYFKFIGDDTINLPTNPMAVVAVVTALLYDFDRGNIDMDRFLIKYYKMDDYEACYQRFCFTVLAGYARAFAGILDYKETVLDAEEEVTVDDYAKESVMPCVSKMIEIVEADAHISDKLRDDLLTILDGFYYSFELSRAKMVKVCWVGLCAVAKNYKPVQSYMREIKRNLENYALI